MINRVQTVPKMTQLTHAQEWIGLALLAGTGVAIQIGKS